MAKLNSKLEWAAFAALAAIFSHPGTEAKILAAGSVIIIFLIADILQFTFKRFLIPAFQIPFQLVVILTLIEIANVKLDFLGKTLSPVLAVSILLINLSSSKISERMETAAFVVIFVLFSAAIQNICGPVTQVFYPCFFIVTAFSIVFLRSIFESLAKRR